MDETDKQAEGCVIAETLAELFADLGMDHVEFHEDSGRGVFLFTVAFPDRERRIAICREFIEDTPHGHDNRLAQLTCLRLRDAVLSCPEGALIHLADGTGVRVISDAL